MTGHAQGFSKDLVETRSTSEVATGGNLPCHALGRSGREVGVGRMHCEGGSPGARCLPMFNFIIDRDIQLSFRAVPVVASLLPPGFSAPSFWHLLFLSLPTHTPPPSNPPCPAAQLPSCPALPAPPAAGSGRAPPGEGWGRGVWWMRSPRWTGTLVNACKPRRRHLDDMYVELLL